MKGFASDNYAGALPEVMAALQQVNEAHARSYGADEFTARTNQLFNELFQAHVDCHYVFNGTGANVLSLSIATQSFSAVICSNVSHIYCDESAAPETFTGCRMMALQGNEQGKLTPEIIAPKLIRLGDMHYAQPAIVSITQSTEYGTVYSIDEIKSLAQLCRAHQLYLHVDGARVLNALASTQQSCYEMFTAAGVDIISFGGTKAGMLYGECVIILNDELNKHAWYKHKQSMQLASKTRFIAAQFDALMTNDLGLKAAQHANNMARRLAKGLQNITPIFITQPVQANGVFALFPKQIIEPLQAQFPFYIWDELKNEVRLMCSWDTTETEVDAFIEACKNLCNGSIAMA